MILLAVVLLAATMQVTATPTPVSSLTLPRQYPQVTAPADCHKNSWLDEKTGMICSAMICDDEPMTEMECEPAVTK